jgi:phosphatidylethanolamine-binding protein (PEBP) family uncharacterized protein
VASGDHGSHIKPPEAITVSSPAFAAGAAIPQRFTCDGDNRSPPLRWSGVPAGTVEAALAIQAIEAAATARGRLIGTFGR